MVTSRSAPAGQSLPVVHPLPAALTAVQAFCRLADHPHCLFLDSALPHEELGRYSFVAADPFGWIEQREASADGLAQLAARIAPWSTDPVPELPPFQGGLAGLVGYEFAHALERLPRVRYDEFRLPVLALGFYDVVLAFDHHAGHSWLISQGFPETRPEDRRRRAEQRAAQVLDWLERPAAEWVPAETPAGRTRLEAPTYRPRRLEGLVSNFSADGYRRTIARAVEFIRAGEIFQVNLSQRLVHPATGDSRSLYLRLRSRNPATFAGYLDGGPFQILSTSPERFLRLQNGEVEARPIKGTRRRTSWPEADMYAGQELVTSGKDRAENIMIVDLMRNDLSRVCRPESVAVTQLCDLEAYAYVQHLVSAIRGTLRPGLAMGDLLAACFPGGSVTGAPKIRSMEIITELEQVARGPYCGSLGYWSFTGACDWNILIRTITAAQGWWQFPVGGGIVVGSDPDREYAETWEKAEGMLKALDPVV